MYQEPPRILSDHHYKEYTKEDRYLGWFYRPHTLTGLFIGFAFLVYFAFTRDDSVDFEMNIKYGLCAVCLVYLLFSALQMRDTLFIRPHPIVWRVVMGCGVLYLLLLIFLLFQNVDDVRALTKKLDPQLGVPLPERSYAENCDRWETFWETLNDEFMLAHFLGWFGKAFLFRDWYLCWVMSILFEVLEISLEHMLPNFAECWWDHIILDVFVCNLIGFSIGLWIVHYFSMKTYNWVPSPNIQEFQWEVLTGWRRLVAVVALIVVINVVELNAFFLKYILWLPPPHPLCIIRLLIWWSTGLPGVREYFQYCTDKNCKKLGAMPWLCLANVTIEVLCCIKWGQGMFPNPHPPMVILSWAIGISLFIAWAIWFYGFRQKDKQKTS